MGAGECVKGSPTIREIPYGEASAPDEVLARMRDAGEECFLLESVEGGALQVPLRRDLTIPAKLGGGPCGAPNPLARYTFLGSGPAARLTVAGGAIREERGADSRDVEGPLLAALARFARRDDFPRAPGLPPFAGGAVGFLSYDAVRLFEEIPDRHPREGSIPDALFLLFDTVAAFDHAARRLFLQTRPDGDRGIARLDRLEKLFTEELPPAPSLGKGRGGTLAPLLGRERFCALVERAKEAILAGEVYQVVLSERWIGPLGADPLTVYRALRTLNPSPYLFFLQTREAAVFGASPEMLVRVRGREVETHPIAGTIDRGETEEEDRAREARLLADPKERAEHVMLVDLARNDLGRVCEIGSVRVSRFGMVEKSSHVQHIVSEVRGTLAPEKSSLEALAACFPAGTLTGAPKIRAMQLIDELEGARRGVYGGAIGYLDFAGDLDFAIAIRAAVVEDGICRVQAGAGIVADSVAENEYREAESKAAALFRAIEIARASPNPQSENRNPKSFP